MVCTKQVYTLAATWTAVGLADTLKTALVDAGTMTDWYDNFLSGTVENRVLQVVNDNTKTYGTIYYWFQFTTGGIFMHIATGWNATTHVPTGTQYQDYFSTTTNATTNHKSIVTLINTTQLTITRYTSQVNTDASFFLIKNGTTYVTLFYGKGSFRNPNSLVDQNKYYFNGHWIRGILNTSQTYYPRIDFSMVAPHVKRTFLGCYIGATSTPSDYQPNIDGFGYSKTNISNSTALPTNLRTILIPAGRTTINTSLSENQVPLVTNILMTPYFPALPSDFGIASYIDNITLAVGDTLVVTSGSNEWDMIEVAASSSSAVGCTMLVARTV